MKNEAKNSSQVSAQVGGNDVYTVSFLTREELSAAPSVGPELTFVLDGSADLTLTSAAGKTYRNRLVRGNYLVLDGGSRSEYAGFTENFRVLRIGFSLALFEPECKEPIPLDEALRTFSAFSGITHPLADTVYTDYKDVVRRVLALCVVAAKQGGAGADLLIRNSILSAFWIIERELCGIPARVRKDTVIDTIVQEIKEHYAEPLSLAEFAERFSYDPSYLSRKFRKNRGKTFEEHLRHVRMCYACLCLRETDAPMEKVAARCGYRDLRAFRRAFIREIGESPSGYRQKGLEPEKERDENELKVFGR